MKIIVANNQKGGVGKSALICQLAFFAARQGLKTLVIDLDHQGNTTLALTRSNAASCAECDSYEYLTKPCTVPVSNLTLIPAFNQKSEQRISVLTRPLKDLEKQGIEAHNDFIRQFSENLDKLPEFDLCLIDTNPNPDIRTIIAMCTADFVFSPIQLKQESIDGLGALLDDIEDYKRLNSNLKFLGMVPNMVEAKRFQQNNLELIQASVPDLLLKHGTGELVMIKCTTVIEQAQAFGLYFEDLTGTTAKNAATYLIPFFNTILLNAGLETGHDRG